MGMDSVELILRVEEHFEIEIGDEEASLISTPGGLCVLIERKLAVLDAEKRSHCPTSRAFYHVRRELMELGVQRANIKPSSDFDSLLRPKRRELWRALSERLGVSLPGLQRSPIWTRVSLLPLAFLPFVWKSAGEATAVLFCFSLFPFWWLLFQATKPFAVHAPEGNRTVADLARRLAWTMPVQNNQSQTPDVWPQLQLIIADELSIAPEKVTRDADLVRDLGLS